MKEFKINEYLSLRLEVNNTVIYVASRKFRTCKYLLFNIETDKAKEYDHFESIDEAIEFYSKVHEHNKKLLDPETELWGHCSNLQAWAENEYDTPLLDMRLAFPLLKRLADVGDLVARKSFKEEVTRRIASGNNNSI